MKYIVEKKEELLSYLLNNVSLSHKKIKSLLKYKNILVNGHIMTQYNYLLQPKDIIEIKEYKTKKHSKELDIIYEDKDIIVVNKKAGLLTISSPNEKEKTLYHMVSEYVKSINKKNPIFIIHRLDKDTSGIVMFAKNEKVKRLYQNNWNDIVTKRKYMAIVEGTLEQKRGTLRSYLKENEAGYVYSATSGKLALTDYIVKKETKNCSLLDIAIKTGRKNQIRVQLKDIGHPIVGDAKYGKKGKNMYLCAYELEVMNPITKKMCCYKVAVPEKFKQLLKDDNEV